MLFICLSAFFAICKSQNSNSTIIKLPDSPDQPYFHFQSFQNEDWSKLYIPSSQGKWSIQDNLIAPHEKMLFTTSANSQYYISSKFPSQLTLNHRSLIAQFEAKYSRPLQCNGAFIKLYSGTFDQQTANSSVPYTIKFGPDFCSPHNRIHFNFTHRNRISGAIIEHHLAKPLEIFDDFSSNNHLFTLIIRNDNTFEIQADTIILFQGSLLDDFIPPINPPKIIDDPNDTKPADFDDKEMIVDKSVKKPKDWDQPEFIVNPAKITPPPTWLLNEPDRIPDPTLTKPPEWDEEFFGKWEAPLIENPKCRLGCGYYTPPMMKNPEYKGRWKAPKIKNPGYKGKWTPRKILNPNYYSDDDVHNFGPFTALSIETNSFDNKIGFNNILISTNEFNTHKWNMNYYFPKYHYHHRLHRNINVNEQIEVVSADLYTNDDITNDSHENIANELKLLLISLWFSFSEVQQFITVMIVFVSIPLSIIFLIVICCGSERAQSNSSTKQSHLIKND